MIPPLSLLKWSWEKSADFLFLYVNKYAVKKSSKLFWSRCLFCQNFFHHRMNYPWVMTFLLTNKLRECSVSASSTHSTSTKTRYSVVSWLLSSGNLLVFKSVFLFSERRSSAFNHRSRLPYVWYIWNWQHQADRSIWCACQRWFVYYIIQYRSVLKVVTNGFEAFFWNGASQKQCCAPYRVESWYSAPGASSNFPSFARPLSLVTRPLWFSKVQSLSYS